jgi:hypothetical protein
MARFDLEANVRLGVVVSDHVNATSAMHGAKGLLGEVKSMLAHAGAATTFPIIVQHYWPLFVSVVIGIRLY